MGIKCILHNDQNLHEIKKVVYDKRAICSQNKGSAYQDIVEPGHVNFNPLCSVS